MKEINRETMEEELHKLTAGLHKLMSEDYSNCVGATRKDGYIAFYHEKRLYSVEHEGSGIVSLVYAKNPYEAIEKVDEFRRIAGEQR